MSNQFDNAIKTVTSFADAEDEAQLASLDDAVQTIASSPSLAMAAEPLFQVFERFPASAGYGVFWSVLHTLETVPGFECELLRSIHRQPSEFALLMVNRLLNSGVNEVNGRSLVAVLNEVASRQSVSAALRAQAAEYGQFQQGRT